MSERRLRVIQRASAIYDLIAVTPFALPGVAAWEIAHLHETAVQLSLPGKFPPFLPTHLFFANVFGIFVVTWSVMRLRTPEPRFAFYDVVLRFAFASTMLFYVFVYDVSRILMFFAAFEVFWGGLQWFAYVRRGVVPRPLPELGGSDAK